MNVNYKKGKGKAEAKYITLFALVFLVLGFFSSILTGGSELYGHFNRPPLSPPPVVFGIAWSLLYTLIGGVTGAVYSYLGKEYDSNVKSGLTFSFVGIILNYLWFPLFFGRGELLAALLDIIIILALNIACTVSFYRVKAVYGYLLIPYSIWLLFAAYLNFGTLMLN